MTELQKQIEKHRKDGEALAKKLRERLTELKEEEADILDQLSLIEGKPVDNGENRSNSKTRRLGKKIKQILEEAGPSGLDSSEVYTAVITEIPGTPRQNVLTHLSRMKRNKAVKVKGKQGSSVYIALNSK